MIELIIDVEQKAHGDCVQADAEGIAATNDHNHCHPSRQKLEDAEAAQCLENPECYMPASAVLASNGSLLP
eukprot:scaffold2972_cov64-Phaeocystis_antarctica.AAC.3